MLLTVGEFQERVTSDLPSLVSDLSELTGRGGEDEKHAWEASLPRLADALTSAALRQIHIHFARREHHVALEYQLPGTSSWCDVVLLGRHAERPSAVVVELKHWETSADRPGVVEGLVEHRGIQELHPSDQLRGYVEYCRRFHSAVLEESAQVHGFVLMTIGVLKHPYIVAPNDKLVANFPVFSMLEEDVGVALPQFLRSRLTEADPQFATAFASGTFHQDRGFLHQIGKAILSADIRHFELLDNQRRAFHLCLAKASEAISNSAIAKRVILVEGPPGSGKSAVAARLWASLVTDKQVPDGNIVLVTTSQSQSSNWTYLIDRAADRRIGRGVARKATSFTPISIPELKRLRDEAGDRNLYKDATNWRANLMDLGKRKVRVHPGAEDNSCLVSLVDEAHALINPEREHGVGQYGFVTGLGSQAFHIIRGSRLTVFFLDPAQSFRARENTTVEDIKAWASQLGAALEEISLQGVQFRCAGSAEYVAWAESLLSGGSEHLNAVYASAWYQDAVQSKGVASTGKVVAFPARTPTASVSPSLLAAAEPNASYRVRAQYSRGGGMDFRIFTDPFEMEASLRKMTSQFSVRLVSSYSRPWKSEGSSYPHRLPAEAMDFHELIGTENGGQRWWSRPWNFVPKGDYTGFVLGRPGLPIHDDPLCEVGCPFAVRGFDFDYLGLLWLEDLLWRDGKWVADLSTVHESGIGVLVRQARKEGRFAPAGPRGVNVLEKVKQAYRILLTRAIRGMYVWIPDNETREHVQRSLVFPN